MATSWKSQQGNGKYALQFETDDKEKYKFVEKASQMAVDGKQTADVVEVVRCKDCIHYRKKEDSLVYDDDTCDILYYCDGSHRTACERDFCSYGKRKEKE